MWGTNMQTVQETIVRPKSKKKNETKERRQPPYNVVLVNDDDHSFDYVINMCQKLFGHPIERGYQIAKQVDEQGRSIVWTGALELAELKRDQIHGFGADPLIARCQGSMTAEIEPA